MTFVYDVEGALEPIRLLVVARHPFRREDMGLSTLSEVERVQLIRRPGAIEAAIDELDPSVMLIDTGFSEGRGFEAIETSIALTGEVPVLALTASPPPYDDVARAIRAGASGFIDVDAHAEEAAAALSTLRDGGAWFPVEDMRPILAGVADDLDTTTTERNSRLTGIMLGLIPLTGLLAALMTYLWRHYLGQIGVRPVDLAVDPSSRIVDSLAGVLLVLGCFGPLLFVGTWLDLVRGSTRDRGLIGWLLGRPRLAHVVLSVVILGTTLLLAFGPHVMLVLVVGPVVLMAVIARAADLSDALPSFLRIKIRPRGVLIGTFAALILFLTAIGGESMLIGPQFGVGGEGGFIAPRVLGFNAQPMLVFNLESGEPRELLYLGGNADLYVLLDPCIDNEIELVSVSQYRLVVIDEVTCAAPDDP